MITTNVIQRVFRIRLGTVTGSAFSLDHAGKQYLVTARHLVASAGNVDRVDIYHEQQWKELHVKVVGLGSDGIDIAVFSPEVQLSPTFPLEPNPDGLALGQQVFFLGFPLGMMTEGGKINREFPIPLVKSGVLSGSENSPFTEFLVDGHNTPGFSGGPLVFTPQGEQVKYRVAGVISGYRLSMLPVHDPFGNQIGMLPENSGIVVAHSISTATDLMNANPIGFDLSQE